MMIVAVCLATAGMTRGAVADMSVASIGGEPVGEKMDLVNRASNSSDTKEINTAENAGVEVMRGSRSI